jgi:hypothetical protein
VANRYLTVDDTTGKRKLGGVVGTIAAPVDEDFDIGGGGAVQVILSNTISAPQKIDVLRNGQMLREGPTADWQRDVILNKITFNYTIPQNAWIRVRLYS